MSEDFDFGTEILKIICFSTENLLSNLAISSEVGQPQKWLRQWLDLIVSDLGTSHLPTLLFSD